MTVTVSAGPLFVINGPLPRRRPFDLLHYAFDVTPEGDSHWESGAQVYPYPSALPDTHNPCSGGSHGTKDSGEPTTTAQFGGFTAYLPITCTTRGMGRWEEFKGRAEAAFRAKESYAVELELAYDDAGVGSPHLTEGGITPLSAAAVKPVEGLALLEDSIAAETAISGVIHAAPSLVAAWSKEFLVFHEQNDLVTANGTRVVAGAAYASPRFHPSDQAAAGATQNWAFATGDVQYMRSEILPLPAEVKEAVDRELNVTDFRVERNYVVDWDYTFLSEVLIDRSL